MSPHGYVRERDHRDRDRDRDRRGDKRRYVVRLVENICYLIIFCFFFLFTDILPVIRIVITYHLVVVAAAAVAVLIIRPVLVVIFQVDIVKDIRLDRVEAVVVHPWTGAQVVVVANVPIMVIIAAVANTIVVRHQRTHKKCSDFIKIFGFKFNTSVLFLL